MPLLLLASAPGAAACAVENRNPKVEIRESLQGSAPGGSIFDLQVSNFEFFLGIDIGRHHDRTVFWLDELAPLAETKYENRKTKNEEPETIFDLRVSSFDRQTQNLSVARLVRTFTNTPFAEQLAFARELLSLLREDGRPLVRRAAIDATGMGAPLAEALAREFSPRVEPVVFTPAVKEDLAFRTKRRMEARLSLLPDTREIRQAFSAVKKIVTPSGNLRFDAERTDAGHADEFWAKALADLAADFRPAASHRDAFLVDGAPLVSPGAFTEIGSDWAVLGWNYAVGTRD
jgi:phage FluMu gp28-like protein